MYENYEREEIVDNNIDLCACFDPIFNPPKSVIREWEKQRKAKEEIPEPTWEDLAVYVQEPDGLYYCCGKNYCIKVTEHFKKDGKEMKELVKEVIQYSAKQK